MLIAFFRRCLDYLARAIASYFKNDFHSFRRLAQFLTKQRTDMQGLNKLIDSCSKHCNIFKFVLSGGDRKSTRDKICHYSFVSVGVLNILGKGPVLVGGEKNLDISQKIVLSDVLHKNKKNLDSCVSEIISLFVAFIIEDQRITLF